MRHVAIVGILVALVGCSQSQPSISITASPTTQTAGVMSCVTLTVSGQANGQPFNNTMDPLPTVQTDYGVLIDPALGGNGSQDTDVNISGSTGTLKLCATDTTPGTAHLVASVSDDYGATATATLDVVFTAPVATGCMPGQTNCALAATTVQFSCTCKNIDAFLDSSLGLVTPCAAVAEDSMGRQVTNANFQFIAEAGQLTMSNDTSSTGQPVYLYYPHQGKNPAPQDVAPLKNEPNWTDNTAGAITHNPRDGLVTLVAYVLGDNSGAVGQYAGDPFVDANDNNQYDLGEEFVPSAGPGAAYSPTQTKYVWAQTKMVWSGTLSKNPNVAKVTHTNSSYNLNIGQSITVTFQVVDDNYNALAANNPAMDNIAWQLMPDGSLQLGMGQPTSTGMFDTFGIDLDPNEGYSIKNPTTATSYLVQVSYSVTVVNARMAMDGLGPQDWTLTGAVSRTGIIDDQGNPGSQQGGEMVPEADVPGGVLSDM